MEVMLKRWTHFRSTYTSPLFWGALRENFEVAIFKWFTMKICAMNEFFKISIQKNLCFQENMIVSF